jgi:hypothetical protein
MFGDDLPADSADAGLQTQAADNLFEKQVLPAGARQRGLHLDLVRMLNVVALQRLEEQRLPAKRMKQERTHVSFLIRPSGDPKTNK